MRERITNLRLRLARLEKEGNGMIDLSGQDFSGQDLSGWDLSGSDLSGADFSYANLRGANLSNCKADVTNFESSDLTGVNLTSTRLVGCNMKMVNLNHSTLSAMRFIECDLTLSDLRESSGTGTSIERSIFHKANLEGSTFNGSSSIKACDFTSCFLKGVKFLEVEISDSNFDGSDFNEVSIKESKLSRSIFTQCSFTEVDIESCNLRKSDFDESDFGGSKILDSRINVCTFKLVMGFSMYMKGNKIFECDFFNSELVGCRLREVHFNFSKAQNSKWMNTMFDQCQINTSNDFCNANLSKAIFVRTAVGVSNFRNVNFRRAILDHSRLVEADVSGALFRETEVDSNTALPKNMTKEQKEGLVY